MTDRQQGTPKEDRVRDVLRDLGSQGGASMPPELVARIEASLDEERHRREPGAPVVPLATRRRRSRAPWLLGAAAAAAAAVVMPGLLDQGGPMGAGSAAESVVDRGADDATQTPSSQSPSSQNQSSQPPTAAEGEQIPFALSVSEHAYTKDRLGSEAAAALTSERRDAAAVPSFSAESPGLGPLATERGAADCLAEIGAPDARPLLVDVGTFDGEPGFLLVAREGSVTRAWAVASGCKPIYDAPVTLP